MVARLLTTPTITRIGFATGTYKDEMQKWMACDNRWSCSVDGLRQGTRRRPVGVRYRCTPGRHRYSEDEANVMQILDPFAEDSWRNVYAGDPEVRPPP